jgi:hypothetical protein
VGFYHFQKPFLLIKRMVHICVAVFLWCFYNFKSEKNPPKFTVPKNIKYFNPKNDNKKTAL